MKKHGAIGFLFAVLLGACSGENGVIGIDYCEDTPVSRLSAASVKSITYHLGNADHRTAPPVRTVSTPDEVKAVMDLVSSLGGYWYAPAGQTYDPESAAKVGEATIVFSNGENEIEYISIGVNYIEARGCGTPVVRHITPEARGKLLNLVGHPAP